MDSIRKPSSINEAWGIMSGFIAGDPEQAALMLEDPDRVVKQRLEAQTLNRVRKRRRQLGSKGVPMLSRSYK